LFYTVVWLYKKGAVDTLYSVRFTEVSVLSSLKNFWNRTTGCGDIAYCLVGYFILSHPVHLQTCICMYNNGIIVTCWM